MSTGKLVREHRRQVNDNRRARRDSTLPGVGLLAIASEFFRRGMPESAAAIENGESTDVAHTEGGVHAQQAIEETQNQPNATEDTEGKRLENVVDERVKELGGTDEPVVTERETTALSNQELAEDLEEMEADPEAYDAAVFSGEVNGNEPQQSLEMAEATHPETLEFEAIDLQQISEQDEATL
ncbi:hypothetical protein [Ancrocorticia populi]|uniref:hypothetical protein n=1 Tax=Ancrocorticia populi TaxID=2175228 RepID=UPI003F9A9445